MDNRELIDYYKYCMVNRYIDVKQSNGHYHPSYNMNSMIIGQYKKSFWSFYYPNELFLLNEMWSRYINANTFAKKCWWEAQHIFQTAISYPFIPKEEPFTIKESTTIAETITYNSITYVFIGGGTKRKVYVSPDKSHVIKIPREGFNLGFDENIIEAKIYSENPNSIYAKCELIENNWLKMEFVEPKYYTKDEVYPSWTLKIAEHQVGFNCDGKLVAYDYGSEI